MALDDYDRFIYGAAQQYKVDPRLLKAMMSVESGGDPTAVGAPVTLANGQTVRARGLMQFLPGTAQQYGVNITDPRSSIFGAANYLSHLLQQYGTPDAALDHYSGNAEGYGQKILDAYNQVNLAPMQWWSGIPGSANFATVAGFGDPHTQGWHEAHLVDIPVPGGGTVTVNRLAANSFQGFLGNLADLGYPMPNVQGFYVRPITGGTGLSQHAFGGAIDVNPDNNPYAKPRPAHIQTDLPPNVSDLAAKWGLAWGGDWQSLVDPMHFEWAGVDPIAGIDYRSGSPQPLVRDDLPALTPAAAAPAPPAPGTAPTAGTTPPTPLASQ